MADLNITVDSKQVVEAKRDILDLERSFSSAYKSAQTFMSAFARTERMNAYANSLNKVARANQEIINNNLGVTKSYKSAEESAKSFTKVLENQERAAREATAALNERLGVTGPSATESGAGFAAIEGQIERLKIKYDSVYAASQLYERSLNELNQAQRMGAISTKVHADELDKLNIEYQQFQDNAATASNRFIQGNTAASRGMRTFGLVTQQAGYQVGDFLVQVQSGTNWMVAFGQQATQLAGLMTTFGGKFVAIGAALSVLIPLATAIGAVFLRTGEESKKASEEVDKLKQSYDSLVGVMERLRLEEQTAVTGFTDEQQRVMNELNMLQSQRNVLVLELEEAYRKANEQIEAFSSSEEERIKATIAGLEDEISKRERVLPILEQLLQNQKDREAEELKIKRAQDFATESLERFVKKTKESEDRLRLAAVQAEKIKTAINSLKDTVINVKVNFEAAFSNFTGQAAEWAGRTFGTMQSIAEGGDPLFSSPRPKSAPALLGEPELPKSAGGGGGGTSALEALIGQLQTEREILDAWYLESQTLLSSASDSELAIVGGKHEALLRLEEEYQSKLKNIRDAGNSTALGDAGIFFEGMAALAAAGGDKTVKAMRIFSAAQALINSYVAFTEVLKDPSFIGRPWARFGAAAKALASGLAAVNAIKGGGSGSIGGGGSPGTSSVSQAGQAPQPQTVYIDSLEPDALYSGQTLMNLFDAFYNENDKRGKVFIVAR